MDVASKANEWIRNLDSLEHDIYKVFQTLEFQEYLLILRSFLRQLLKQPENRVKAIYSNRIPIREGTMTVKELIIDTSRKELFETIDAFIYRDIDARVHHSPNLF